MGTVSITSSAGEKFIISFSNSNRYNLDELLAAKSRTSQKALVVEVRKNENIARKALKQLEIDLTKNITDTLGREEVVNNVNNIINSVYNVYGRDGDTSAFAVQLINAKITTYLKEVVGRDDISFDVTIYDNRANITYKLPESFIDGQFVEYYEKFYQLYNQNTNVCSGGLSITDSVSSFDVTRSNYVDTLLGGASTNKYYGTGGHYCNDLHYHQCSPDSTTHLDLDNLYGNTLDRTALINELKKLFVTKKALSEKVESRYIKADIGLFRSVKIEDDLKMNNIITDGVVSGNTVLANNLRTQDLAVTNGTITLSDDNTSKYYQLTVDSSENALVFTGVVDGKAIRQQLLSIDVTELDDGYLFYNNEDGCFYTRDINFVADDGKIKLDRLPDEVIQLLSTATTKEELQNLKEYEAAQNQSIRDIISKLDGDIKAYYYTKEETDRKIADAQLNSDISLDNYFTKEETLSEITKAVSSQSHFDVKVVEVLPATGENNIIYLVPDNDNSEKGIYIEYLWVNNNWESIGTTEVRLDGYATEDWVDNKLLKYAKTEDIPTLTSQLTNDSGFITRHQDISHLATKDELNNLSLEHAKYRFNTIELQDMVLPEIGEENTIYLVPTKPPADIDYTNTDVYNEYIWKNNRWEAIGISSSYIDSYATETYVNIKINEASEQITEQINSKADVIHAHSSSDITHLGESLDSILEDLPNKYMSRETIESNYITGTEVRNIVQTQVETKIEEVVTGENSQVDAIKYTDFDDLED